MYRYKDVTLNYQDINPNLKPVLVFLHGWGQNIAMMQPLAQAFQKEYRLIIVDLPGHGKSSEPKSVWDLAEFANCLHELLLSLKISKPIIVGHSFGGKIALLYASKFPTQKLVLLASPYEASSKSTSPKVQILRRLKKIPGLRSIANYFKKHTGSTDYRNATPMMRDILVKHINTDLKEEAKRITCPTLLIWGTNDEHVPYESAKVLEKLIPNAGLVTYEGKTHYAYLEDLNKTIKVLQVFFKSKE